MEDFVSPLSLKALTWYSLWPESAGTARETSLIQFGFFSLPVSFKNLENNKENHDFHRFCSRLIRILYRRKSTLSVFELKVKRVVRNFSASNLATDSKRQLSSNFAMRPRGGSRKFRKRWPGLLPAI